MANREDLDLLPSLEEREQRVLEAAAQLEQATQRQEAAARERARAAAARKEATRARLAAAKRARTEATSISRETSPVKLEGSARPPSQTSPTCASELRAPAREQLGRREHVGRDSAHRGGHARRRS